ncbi:MYBBP1A family protein [Megaselia abdita]
MECINRVELRRPFVFCFCPQILQFILSRFEDADAIVGQILVCGALLRSSKLVEASKEDISAVIQVLLAATKHRTYHTALAYSFVTELLNTISEEQFVESVWPHLEPEIIRPWPKQTINTVHCLFIVQKEFPSVVSSKYLKSKFTNSQILYPGNFKQILKIFWDSNNPNIILHEAFNALGPILANSKHLINFWTSEVEDYLKTPNKLKEIQTLKIISDIIDNLDPETVKISELLTNNFIKMMVASIQTIKTNKETLKAFYDDFFESLNNKFAKIIDEHEKVSILKKLIIHPGTICLEKYTSSRIVHQLIFQLKEEGIKELFEVYKAIFLNKTVKNLEDPAQNWLNFERLNAGFILQTLLLNKNAQNGNWRAEQLKVFMKFGLFYVSDKDEITKKENAGKVSEEFGEQMKNMFYACLQAKLPSLEEEKKMLVSLAQELNEFLAKKNVAKCFRGKFEENLLSIWSKVFKDVTSTKSKNQNLQLVFNILLLHMGLQLFRDAEMAESAILDLEKCMERTKAKKKSDDDEPEWIEVVTDLFLHLLSQNNGSLRHVVNSVFPHLCASLNLTAVHQILAVLDMKNHNPLENGSQQEGEESDEEEVEAEEEESDEDEDETDEEEDADDNDDDDEDNEDVEEEEEESTVTDKLRNAVSIALGSSMKVDDDQCSVDLNDMTEEEGKQLDEALSAAFKAIKKTSPSATKKSKSHRIQTTTVMHFRIRVLDLLEIYLQNKPTQLVTIEVMLDLFNMIEFCNENDLKPLQNKVEKLLQKLTAIKQFEKDEEGDINEENICDFIRLIVEKKVGF